MCDMATLTGPTNLIFRVMIAFPALISPVATSFHTAVVAVRMKSGLRSGSGAPP